MIEVKTFLADTHWDMDREINEWLVEQQKNPFFKIIEYQYHPFVIADYDYKISAQVVYSYETEEEKELRDRFLGIMKGETNEY